MVHHNHNDAIFAPYRLCFLLEIAFPYILSTLQNEQLIRECFLPINEDTELVIYLQSLKLTPSLHLLH